MARGPMEWLRMDNGLPLPDLVFQLDALPDDLSDRIDYGLKEGETREFQYIARSALSFIKSTLNGDWILLSALIDQEILSNIILSLTLYCLNRI